MALLQAAKKLILHRKQGNLHPIDFHRLEECIKNDPNLLIPELLEACKGAIAALSQHKTYPADIAAAKLILASAIAKTEGKE